MAGGPHQRTDPAKGWDGRLQHLSSTLTGPCMAAAGVCSRLPRVSGGMGPSCQFGWRCCVTSQPARQPLRRQAAGQTQQGRRPPCSLHLRRAARPLAQAEGSLQRRRRHLQALLGRALECTSSRPAPRRGGTVAGRSRGALPAACCRGGASSSGAPRRGRRRWRKRRAATRLQRRACASSSPMCGSTSRWAF